MQLVIHSIEGGKEIFDVDRVFLFDVAHQGEIGIYAEHTHLSGVGNYIIYNDHKRNESFLYSVQNNQIDIYLV